MTGLPESLSESTSADRVTLKQRVAEAIDARQHLLDPRHETALRLFNGFYEGNPDLVIDLYARTLVLYNYADPPADGEKMIQEIYSFLLEKLSWVQAVIVKTRNSSLTEERRGRLIYGHKPDSRIREHGVWYSLELCLQQDASFYLDTRNLRSWALQNLEGKSVLNTFAYTGSLGVAARAGGARDVVYVDINRRFLNVAKASYTLNGFPIQKGDFISADFFTQTSQFRRSGRRFDCVFLDPPFFSITDKGRVDLQANSIRLINKIRPLINDGGYLVAINNALYVNGADYYQSLERLCADGYLRIDQIINVPQDYIGYPPGQVDKFPRDPRPFNHTTKIAVLVVRRKSP